MQNRQEALLKPKKSKGLEEDNFQSPVPHTVSTTPLEHSPAPVSPVCTLLEIIPHSQTSSEQPTGS